MCWFKGALLPSVFIVFFSLITSTRCDSIKLKHAKEGEAVQLNFPYPCYSSKITLQFENRSPFYDSAKPEYLELNPDQSERFIVEDPTEEEDHCFLQLSIDPVKRDDGGTYILIIYDGNYITTVGLHVDFLPGVAHCSFGGSHYFAGHWEKLHCKAAVGSMLGQIQCYQGGRKIPLLGTPSENDITLKQGILVRHNRHPVYCCSSQLIEPKERCDCNDFVWDPLSGSKVDNTGGPCPTTTHVPNMTPTNFNHHNGISSNVRAIIPTKGEIREHLKFRIVAILFVVMFAIAYCALMIYIFKARYMLSRENAYQQI